MRTVRALTAILATTLTLGPIAIAQSASSVPVSLTIDAAANNHSVSAFLGEDVWLGTGHSVTARELSHRSRPL